MLGLSGCQTCFSQKATLFIGTTAHFFASAEPAGERHVNSLLIVNYSVIVSFCGHIQDQPVRSRSAVWNHMTRFVVHGNVYDTDGYHTLGLVLAPEN